MLKIQTLTQISYFCVKVRPPKTKNSPKQFWGTYKTHFNIYLKTSKPFDISLFPL